MLNFHRRAGKSHFGGALLIDRCLSRPGQQCTFAAPTEKQVAAIAVPNLNVLLRTCPPQLRPRQRGHEYIFRRPGWSPTEYSTLKLVGCDYRHGDLLRGPWSDAVFLDEVGFTAELEYLVHDVLLYQFRKRKDPLLMMVSTPPTSMDHDFCRPGDGFVPRAMECDRYLKISTDDNPEWTSDDDAQLMEELGALGGRASISYRREGLCEFVSDEESLIVPEYTHVRDQIFVDSWPQPTHFFPWVGLDTGFSPDYNGVLFTYVDFEKAKLVIEDELWLRNITTGEFAQVLRDKEEERWGKAVHKKSLRRVGDITQQQLADLQREHGIFIRPADKWDRESALATLRTGIASGRIVLLSRCKHLDYQLRNGTWNDKRTDFSRSKTIGHWDLGAALNYLYRLVSFHENPFPEPIYNPAVTFQYDRPQRQAEKVWGQILGRNVGRRR